MFDEIFRVVGAQQSRRALSRLFVAAASAPLLLEVAALIEDSATGASKARKPRRYKKKRKFCLNGTPVKTRRKKRIRRWKRQGATKGPCPTPPPDHCIPSCDNVVCGGSDGCNGVCGCAAGSVCASGSCEACTITCDDIPTTCGLNLAAAISTGGTHYVCPGTYEGQYFIATSVELFGAGNGTDPATNTILSGGNVGRVIGIISGTVNLHNLTVTDANVTSGPPTAEGGGFLAFTGTTLNADTCTFTGNEAESGGGGMYSSASGTLQNCTFTGNTATAGIGGGLYVGGSTVEIINTVFSGNTAETDGGGVYASSGTTTFSGGCQITGNTAAAGGSGSGGGIFVDAFTTVTLSDTAVTNNQPDNCSGISC